MDSTFQPENSPLSKDLEITPESESMEDLPPLEDEPELISGLGMDSGDEDNPQDVGNVVDLGRDMTVQPEPEDLQTLPEAQSDEDSSLQDSASADVSPLQKTQSSLVRLPMEPDMAIVSQNDTQREFAESIRSGKYVEAVATVVSKLCHLEIVTIVEDEDDPRSPVGLAHSQGIAGQRMITRMDLVGGDITKVIGKRFIERSEYKPLQEMHNQQVTEGLGIMKTNLDNLVKAINSLKNLKDLDGKS
jgi:hypothetical protein